MTNEERDLYIKETHDAVVVLIPDMKDLKHTVYGNGQPGLKQTVCVMKTKQEECQKKQAKQMPLFANYLSLAAVIVALLTVLVSV